jgi:hypothetical protein
LLVGVSYPPDLLRFSALLVTIGIIEPYASSAGKGKQSELVVLGEMNWPIHDGLTEMPIPRCGAGV